ncbi:MAG: YwaF family protein, partial [Erysipelotrichales bacterium]|nr:YwaF family protein [Erysipelotrichales bacterium]
MDYGFFDDSYTVAEKGYNGADRMSPQQFLLMGSVFVLIVILSVLLRKKKKEDVFRIYKVLSVLMPIVEISKLAFSTVADLTHGEPFNLGGILPLYTCSMLLYFLPVVAWGKGKLQRYSMAFFVSIGLVAGMSNFVYLSAAGFYPLFTYGCLYSVFFHAVIVFVGMSLMITEIYTPS